MIPLALISKLYSIILIMTFLFQFYKIASERVKRGRCLIKEFKRVHSHCLTELYL